jgi:hypothetical protein
LDPVDAAAVTRALEAEGLKVDANEADFFWALRIEVYARPQTAILILAPESEYFVAMALVNSPALNRPIEELPATTLSTIIKLQSEEVLAKFVVLRLDSIESTPTYATSSPCSRRQWDGRKLRLRLEACATLAAQIRGALFDEILGPPLDKKR